MKNQELVKPINNVLAVRNDLVKDYYGDKRSLSEMLLSEGEADIESLLLALIDEIVKESDHLLGNELIATESGDLQSSSVMSVKRAELLEKVIKSVQIKQQFEKDSGVDLDSPSMMIVFNYFMEKVKDVFDQIGVSDEQSDVFFRTLGQLMNEWKRELQDKFKEIKSA